MHSVYRSLLPLALIRPCTAAAVVINVAWSGLEHNRIARRSVRRQLAIARAAVMQGAAYAGAKRWCMGHKVRAQSLFRGLEVNGMHTWPMTANMMQ